MLVYMNNNHNKYRAYNIRILKSAEFPEKLKEIPDPPKVLYQVGNLPADGNKVLCIVGSRKYTPYGKGACESLVAGLRGFPITIVSGLAFGIDSIAHTAALTAGLQTVAVPGSGLNPDVLYPSAHRRLAHKIIQSGGGLLSEFEPDFVAAPWGFPQRNRIMAALSDAVLVVEAGLQSGTLITSRYATDYNRDVLTIPGSIFSSTSAGPHMLIKLGATPVTSSTDILEALGIAHESEEEAARRRAAMYSACTAEEKILIDLLQTPQNKETLLEHLHMPAHTANIIISMAELKGLIKEKNGLLYVQ